MYFGFNAYSDDELFDARFWVDNYYDVSLSNMYVDEIQIQENSDEFDKTKTEWDQDTVLLARFQNDLEAGNISLSGQLVQYIKLQRRIKGEYTWQDYAMFDYKTDVLTYIYMDKYVANHEIYEYSMTPVAPGGLEGRRITGEIEVLFKNFWLMDKDHTYKIAFSPKHEGVTKTRPSAVFYPMGSNYPIVSYSGALHYYQGSLNCMVYIDDYCNQFNNIENNARESKHARERLINFLNNKKPKVLKDNAGNMWLISVTGSVAIEFKPETNNVMANVTFEWVEIGDADSVDNLKSEGLLDTGVISY